MNNFKLSVDHTAKEIIINDLFLISFDLFKTLQSMDDDDSEEIININDERLIDGWKQIKCDKTKNVLHFSVNGVEWLTFDKNTFTNFVAELLSILDARDFSDNFSLTIN